MAFSQINSSGIMDYRSQSYQRLTSGWVKNAPMGSWADLELPMDMSLSSRDPQSKTQHQFPVSLDHLTYPNNQIIDSYLSSQILQRRSIDISKRHIKNMSLDDDDDDDDDTRSSSPSTPPVVSYDSEMKLIARNKTWAEPKQDKTLCPVDLFPAAIQHQRAKREFVPENRKDNSYWCKRLRNNESARRSRVKRKTLEKMMEVRLIELKKENVELKHEVAALKKRYYQEKSPYSDIPESQEQTARSSPVSLASLLRESAGKADDENISCSSEDARLSDDSRMRSVSALNRPLAPADLGKRHSAGGGYRLKCRRREPTNISDNCIDLGYRVDFTGALDLTGGQTTCTATSPEPQPLESLTISSDRTRCSNDNSFKTFPLKCRWKKDAPLTEELQ